jgi:hypothetical protein
MPFLERSAGGRPVPFGVIQSATQKLIHPQDHLQLIDISMAE